ncbi:MAG: prepilin-type N-terminal cleavage/methylation domain-containing protein [Pirellulaceae bacterium]|nr:prepilin-type N-terminal cleavage/methylation domain-containing protein [Pirellulaceae bacterium]
MRMHEKYRRCPHHRGVTLVELMFAIGILLVGLLGVAALIPLAGFEIDRGLTADRMSVTGRNAVQEFDIRSMRRADMYVNPDGTPFNPNFQSLHLFPAAQRSISFCIDPGYLHFHATNTPPANRTPLLFPSFGPLTSLPEKEARMHRIALRNHPGGTIMHRLLAERLFVARDDLAIDRPSDPTLPPQQVYGSNTTRRQYNGSFSWFATLVPELHQPTGVFDQYLLSVVVLDDRDLLYDSGLGTTSRPRPIPERVVEIELLGGGFGGGAAILKTSSTSPVSIDVRSGDWIMLSARAIVSPPINVAIARINNSEPVNLVTRDYFRWYQVVSSELDPRPVAGGGWVRHISLEGPDWSRPEWWDTTLPAVLQMPTRAVMVRDAVGVFEKTIRLENTSLWDSAP